MESKAFHTICIQLPSRFCVVPARLDTGEAFTVSVGKDIDADGQSNWKFSCSIRIIRCVIDAQCEWHCNPALFDEDDEHVLDAEPLQVPHTTEPFVLYRLAHPSALVPIAPELDALKLIGLLKVGDDTVVKFKIRYLSFALVQNLFERTCAKAVMREKFDGSDKPTLTKEDFALASSERAFESLIKKKSNARIGFN